MQRLWEAYLKDILTLPLPRITNVIDLLLVQQFTNLNGLFYHVKSCKIEGDSINVVKHDNLYLDNWSVYGR